MVRFPLMIDSGAYSAWSKGEAINLDEYINFCHEILQDHPQAICVNLDVVGDGKASFQNWKTMRASGLLPLPVYHVITDEKWLKKYLARSDYVGIGAIAAMANAKRKVALDRIFEAYLTDKDGMPTVKTHAMGVTSFSLMKRYPWYSIDSTSWLQVAMYGHICQPKRRNGKWDYSCPPTKVGFSTQCGDKRFRGKHYQNMSPHEKKILLRYLRELKFPLGFYAKSEENEKKRYVLRGVSTWHGTRTEVCLRFFAEFLKTAPWPRPFLIPRSKGFGL